MNSSTTSSPDGATLKKRSIVKVHPPHHQYTKLELYHSLLSPSDETNVEETIHHNEVFPFHQTQSTANPSSLLSASPPKRIKYDIAHLKDAFETNSNSKGAHPTKVLLTPPLWLPYKPNDNAQGKHSHKHDDEAKKEHSLSTKQMNEGILRTSARALEVARHTLHFRKTYKVTSNLNLHDT